MVGDGFPTAKAIYLAADRENESTAAADSRMGYRSQRKARLCVLARVFR
jgi:hypothetical protein